MSKQKLTPWFPASVKPARDGVYLTRKTGFSHDGVYRKWKNGMWHFNSDSVDVAAKETQQSPAIVQTDRQWRGLAEQPK
jgi:hypothetical protein